MPTIETLLLFTAAAMVLNLSPGPSNFFVMGCSLAQGSKAGVVSVFGLASGALVHVFAAVLGVSAIFAYSADAYMVLKYTGAAYLIWLGIQQFRTSGAHEKLNVPKKIKPTKQILRESALVEILNPKTALFFIALLPQFVDPALGPVSTQMFVLGLITIITAIPCDLMVAFGSARLAKFLARNSFYEKLMDRISGTIFIALGVFVAVSKRP